MRARLVLITALCGVALLAGACQQNTAGSQHTGVSDTSGPHRSTRADNTSSAASSTASTSATSVRTVFDRQAVQTSVLRLLEDDYGIDRVQQVSCPQGEEVVDGNTFRCTVVIDGQAKQVEITVAGDEGEYVVARPE